MFPAQTNVPRLTRALMAEVDRLMVEDYKITLIQMMENAGSCLARFLSQRFPNGEVLAFCGPGGNGGGAMVAARRLHSWGRPVSVVISEATVDELSEATSHQLESLVELQIPILMAPPAKDLREFGGIIVDGLLGYGILGEPRGLLKDYIEFIRLQQATVISLDLPSGIHPDEGLSYHPQVKANATLTFVLPKNAFGQLRVRKMLGELYLADIGVPSELFNKHFPELGYQTPFTGSDIVWLE